MFNLFGKKKEKSANTAHSRLKLAINSDRVDLDPETISKLEVEMRELLTKYIPVRAIDMNKNYNKSVNLLNISIELDKPE